MDPHGPGRRRQGPTAPPARVEATAGLWVEHLGSGFVGVVEGLDRRLVALRDDSGLLRSFAMEPGAFRSIETGAALTLIAPSARGPHGPRLTKAGAIVTAGSHRAQVAKASRILVEGTHDAELLEKVWGEELRSEAIVVEPIGGADNLAAELSSRGPGPRHRIGVLLDHLVEGSKELRIADAVTSPHVLVTGHPYVDVWQAVRPHVVGLERWPEIPRGQSWKDGITVTLGGTEPAQMWRRILGRVGTYRDLEPTFVGAVEQLLDFVCAAD